jgi:hypothetical protein
MPAYLCLRPLALVCTATAALKVGCRLVARKNWLSSWSGLCASPHLGCPLVQMSEYPGISLEAMRSIIGRFGITGAAQVGACGPHVNCMCNLVSTLSTAQLSPLQECCHAWVKKEIPRGGLVVLKNTGLGGPVEDQVLTKQRPSRPSPRRSTTLIDCSQGQQLARSGGTVSR